MKPTLRYPPLLAALALVFSQGCADEPTAAGHAAAGAALESQFRAGTGGSGVTVMTQNLYVGADVDAVITALATPDPDDDIPALLAAISTLDRTDFPTRAKALAREIGRTRPDVIGLQEVSTIDVDLPPLGVSVHEDFLQVLQAALQARGLNYTLAVAHDNFTATPAPGISLQDRDVMLVATGRVQVLSSSAHQFTDNLGVVAPGVDLERGWVQMSAVIGGRTYALASLHTEGTGPDALLLGLHASQVNDVVTSLGSASPAIVIGDFNSEPTSPAYQVMQGANFTDVWAALRPGNVGLTCCHLADLSDPTAAFTQRIDYVWTRGTGDDDRRHSAEGMIVRYGALPFDRIKNSAGEWIWPSDHAGLVAVIVGGR